jgi:hypothetical protein
MSNIARAGAKNIMRLCPKLNESVNIIDTYCINTTFPARR